MNDGLKIAGIVVSAIAGLTALSIGMGWISLTAGRPMAKYAEQTRKEVYDTSRQYEQGTNRDVARYCEQMRTADTTAAKRAVAGLIRTTVSTYDGELSPDNADCVSEAKGI